MLFYAKSISIYNPVRMCKKNQLDIMIFDYSKGNISVSGHCKTTTGLEERYYNIIMWANIYHHIYMCYTLTFIVSPHFPKHKKLS